MRASPADRLQPGLDHRSRGRRAAAAQCAGGAGLRPAHAGLPGPAALRAGLPRLLRPAAPGRTPAPPQPRRPATLAQRRAPQRLHRIVDILPAPAGADPRIPGGTPRPAVLGPGGPGPGHRAHAAADPPPLRLVAGPAGRPDRLLPGRPVA